jgi:hypothetical protein
LSDQATIDAAGVAFARARTAAELDAAAGKYSSALAEIPDQHSEAMRLLRGVYARKRKELK